MRELVSYNPDVLLMAWAIKPRVFVLDLFTVGRGLRGGEPGNRPRPHACIGLAQRLKQINSLAMDKATTVYFGI